MFDKDIQQSMRKIKLRNTKGAQHDLWSTLNKWNKPLEKNRIIPFIEVSHKFA